MTMTLAPSAIADGTLRYSSVWEDYRLLERGLVINGGSYLLVIASAGCNVLNLLVNAPRRIVALDFNPAQTALLELKLAAIRCLSHGEFVELLGVRPSTHRLSSYARIRSSMSQAAQRWWDGNLPTIEAGIEGSGRLDRYIAEFREHRLVRVHDRAIVNQLLAIDDDDARRRFARHVFFTAAFENVFRGYFTRESLGRGRDTAQLRYVDDVDVGEWFWRRLQWVATELPTRGNFYLERFLRGGLADADNGPPYLHSSNYERLRALVSRVEVVTDSLEAYLGSAPRASHSAAALSDVFEYMSQDDANTMFDRVSDVVCPGGRVAFWNLLVQREPRTSRLRTMPTLSRELSRCDRSWFYRAFHVGEVLA
jgi:S-adenosylmethionine-diacylglycerol 3-amino-3-carboxypropyl transferase